jgi:hypothetical protein
MTQFLWPPREIGMLISIIKEGWLGGERSKGNGFTIFDVVVTKGNSKVTLCDWQWFWRMCSSHNVKCTHTRRPGLCVCCVFLVYYFFLSISMPKEKKTMQIMNELRTYTQSPRIHCWQRISLSFFFLLFSYKI